jgi:hypothetical protein
MTHLRNAKIGLSNAVVDWLTRAFAKTYYNNETPERMAWVYFLIRKLPDKPEWFPRGKWATIQHIEGQLDSIAEDLTRNHFSGDFG